MNNISFILGHNFLSFQASHRPVCDQRQGFALSLATTWCSRWLAAFVHMMAQCSSEWVSWWLVCCIAHYLVSWVVKWHVCKQLTGSRYGGLLDYMCAASLVEMMGFGHFVDHEACGYKRWKVKWAQHVMKAGSWLHSQVWRNKYSRTSL